MRPPRRSSKPLQRKAEPPREVAVDVVKCYRTVCDQCAAVFYSEREDMVVDQLLLHCVSAGHPY